LNQFVPDCVEDVERVVELGFVWVVFEREKAGVAEVNPGDKTEYKNTISGWTGVDVQH